MAKKSKKPTKKAPKKAAATKAKHTKPKARALPGMEDARIKDLDEACDSIDECRASINSLKSEEADLEKRALALMRKHQKTSWRHAGVELVRIPGEERLRVRTSKANATAEAEEEVAEDATPDTEQPELPTSESETAELLGQTE